MNSFLEEKKEKENIKELENNCKLNLSDFLKNIELNGDLHRLKNFNPRFFYSAFINSPNGTKNFAYTICNQIFDKPSYYLSEIDTFLSGLDHLFEKGKKRHAKKTLSGYLYNQMHELVKNSLQKK